MKTVQLLKGKEAFLERRHPWIFSGAIKTATKEIEDGEIIKVNDYRDNFCAAGFFQAGSIAVRILTFKDEDINDGFWENRLEKAISLRKNLGLMNENTNICRLVHGEGDLLSGLIIDFYNGIAILQAHAVGMYLQRENIAKALKHILKRDLKAVYCKSSATLPERLNAVDDYLIGNAETPHIAFEDSKPFSIDWITGQKTGFFIDQRENRKKLAQYCRGKKVLNTFCYSGGFSIYALQAGADLVHSLDSSSKAMELVEINIALGDYAKKHKSIQADAVKYMNNLEEDYDVIILDPPAFAKHKNKRHQAIKAYTRLNANAIRQIKPGGIIFTFSCSQVVEPLLFQKAVVAAAIQCGRDVKILEQLHQPADHPISAFHPEGEYLKGLIIQVD